MENSLTKEGIVDKLKISRKFESVKEILRMDRSRGIFQNYSEKSVVKGYREY